MDSFLYDSEILALMEALARDDADAREELERADREPAWDD